MKKDTKGNKVTIKLQLVGFIKSKRKIALSAFKNTNGNAKIFWDGYNQCLDDLSQRFNLQKP